MLRLVLFFGLLAFFALGALYHPSWSLLGYMAHYMIGAERKWWHAPLNPLGLRYSFTFAVLTALMMVVHWKRLRFGRLLHSQEKLALSFLALIWLLTLLTPATVGRYELVDHASIKMTKVMVFCLMLTHAVTEVKYLNRVIWLIVCSSLVIGLEAYEMPRSAFSSGRLDGRVGGTDFLDANHLAIFLVASTVMTGVLFMRSGWKGRLVCLVAGVFSLNAIVLCRSRAAVLGLMAAAGVILLGAPSKYRLKLIVATVVAAAGLLYLSDPRFLERMGAIADHAGAIAQGEEAEDASAMARIYIWRGARKMIADHPLGVGPGNFNQNIGRYAPQVPGMSPHSTYFQTAAELGLPGLVLFLVIVGNGVLTTRRVLRQSALLPEEEASSFRWTAQGLRAVLVAYATYAVFGHLAYLECLWWYLLLPVCLERAFENAQNDALEKEYVEEEWESPVSEDALCPAAND
jgi:putative inorganic carbon (hco3(-)) transporter